MIPYQWTITVLGLSIAGVILWLVRREHLRGPYAVWWLAVSVTIFLLSLFPSWVDQVAGILGVGYPPILPVVLGVGLLLIKILTSDLQRSRQETRFRRMVQRVAMLEGQLADLQQKLQQQAERNPGVTLGGNAELKKPQSAPGSQSDPNA